MSGQCPANVVVDGSPADRDVAVRLEAGGKLLALATIFRDDASLMAELEMERLQAQNRHHE